jgi:(2Fe-2S) ferredoxin
MSKYKTKSVSPFSLEGRFLGFAAKEGYKLKYLRLATATGEVTVKIPKEFRLSLYRTLSPGIWVQVSGEQKFDSEKREIKFKAYQIVPSVPGAEPGSAALTVDAPPSAPVAATPNSNKETILVCQKSDCCKRGGNALFKALQTELGDRGLADQVTLKPTGCMKLCKMGPNLVMPDKTRYSQIQPKTVPALLEKHFPSIVSST